MSGEETSYSFSHCEGTGKSTEVGAFVQGPCGLSLPDGAGHDLYDSCDCPCLDSVCEFWTVYGRHHSPVFSGIQESGPDSADPEGCSCCLQGPASLPTSLGFSPSTEIWRRPPPGQPWRLAMVMYLESPHPVHSGNSPHSSRFCPPPAGLAGEGRGVLLDH